MFFIFIEHVIYWWCVASYKMIHNTNWRKIQQLLFRHQKAFPNRILTTIIHLFWFFSQLYDLNGLCAVRLFIISIYNSINSYHKYCFLLNLFFFQISNDTRNIIFRPFFAILVHFIFSYVISCHMLCNIWRLTCGGLFQSFDKHVLRFFKT